MIRTHTAQEETPISLVDRCLLGASWEEKEGSVVLPEDQGEWQCIEEIPLVGIGHPEMRISVSLIFLLKMSIFIY